MSYARTPSFIVVAFAGLFVACGGETQAAQPGPGGDSGAMGDSSPGAGADTGTADAENEAEGGVNARDGAVADALPEVDGASTTFTLTSSAFADMGDLDSMFLCGSDVSPPLAWTPGPAGTQSYVVVMTDAKGLYYWVLWDIPAATTSLPRGVDHAAMPATPAGSEQIASGLDASTWSGYAGPCPRLPQTPYTFAVYALSVATLTGVTTSSAGSEVFAAVQASTLASAKLTGLATRYKS